MAYSQFGTNSEARRKRVKYIGTSTTIYEGMPVCYEFDSITNVLGYSKSSAARGTSTTEGYQNEGKFLRVEEPADDNILWFAGVVANGSWVGKTGTQWTASHDGWIEIFIPNGAIVPVRAGVYCTVGRTVLSVISATQYLGHPLSATQAYPVAIAEETVDRSTAGIVLAKLCPQMFIHQDNTGDALLYGTGATIASASQVLNSINASSAHTGGYATAFMIKNYIAGVLAASGGGAALIGYLEVSGSITATTSYTRSILGQLQLSGTISGSNIHLCGVMAQLAGTPTFTACSKVACLMCDNSLAVAPTAGDLSFIRMANNGPQHNNVKYAFDVYGGYGVNYLFNFATCAGITENFISNGGTGNKTLKTGSDWKKIKVSIDGSDFYLIAMNNPTES